MMHRLPGDSFVVFRHFSQAAKLIHPNEELVPFTERNRPCGYMALG